MLLKGYARSPFRDFGCCVRIVVDLNEEDFQLISNHYNSNFATYELSPWIYSIKVILEVVYTMDDQEGTVQIEYDDLSMKTKINLNRFLVFLGVFGLDKNSFFKTLLGSTPYLEKQPTNANHADFAGVYPW